MLRCLKAAAVAMVLGAPASAGAETMTVLGSWSQAQSFEYSRAGCVAIWECKPPQMYLDPRAYVILSPDVRFLGNCVGAGSRLEQCLVCASEPPARLCRVEVTTPPSKWAKPKRSRWFW